MKKTTKAAIAAGGAAVLLLGGAGSLAFWSDSGTVAGGTITTGSASLSDGTCDEGWVYATGTDAGNPVTAIVPGDAITRDCTFTINGVGDHLTVNLTAPEALSVTATTGTPTTLGVTASASYVRDGVALANGASFAVDGPETLQAAITVTFPYGTATTVNANDTQSVVGQLDDITVGLTQDQSSGANPNA
ncbi:alternate-type signal peptide domain-containing protein [Curtobacterium flaccumfaciens]|uniref:alternate-type signal peptide domain-containing protein n=1 Tax=Curtobacterium flaccumfaciens TaxID=2035 RepID=UPI001BDE1238|nr:alternate-type signal peptide domain-containing protein [Curtobacterium flaccumfaciens]MBT1671937.1 alternate-type signal peptide domain-containing protein [Curtobacterium flaccumfaciens pv. flaccumfaciens]